ncbi:hypothetical protein P4597_27545 [Peribacillus simplex]|uniref:hypothetical protein n=1 Tax=Peribacillus simplex TaxID=1478 RepID=UPI002E1D26B5|nr:hypothetical protein [Peribacillus simplex]
MVGRHYQGIRSSSTIHTNYLSDLLPCITDAKKFRLVHKSILKKIAIPFAAITTGSLFFTFKSALAATKENPFGSLTERGDVTKGIFSKENIANRGGGLGEFKSFFESWDTVIKKFNEITVWFNEIHQHVAEASVNLISYIYEILTKVILHTPLFIFNNSYLKNTSLTLAMVSITLVTILTIFESIMQISKQRHTKFTDVLKRYPIAIGITGFAPFLFETGFKIINKLSSAITQIGGAANRNGVLTLDAPTNTLDVLIMLIFDGMLLGLLIPIFLQNGRRWFDLLTLSVVSPLALTAFCFDRHRHYFDKWWDQIKRLSLVQIVYSVFIMLMGVFIYGTRFMTGGFFEVLIFKMLITLGSLYRLANPPNFVKRMTDNGEDVVDMGTNYFNTFKRTFDTVTLRNFKPLTLLRKSASNKKSKIAKLRLKHGKRNVGDLL